MSESVYVLKNPSYDLLKIGKTKRDIKKRVKELSKPTGVPTPFILTMIIKTENCDILEKKIHLHLDNYRTSNKEFFKISEEELYTKLTEEMNLTVKKITITNDDEADDNTCDDDSWCDSGIKSKRKGCTDCGGNCGKLEPKFEKEHKQLDTVTQKALRLYENAASQSNNKYYTVKHSPIAEDDERKKNWEFICEHKNNCYISGEGFKCCRIPSLVNKLYEYDFDDNMVDDVKLHNELKVFRNDFNIFIPRSISELENAIYAGDRGLKEDESFDKTYMFEDDTKYWRKQLKELSKKIDKMSEQLRKWC